jgi:hypothetical protein
MWKNDTCRSVFADVGAKVGYPANRGIQPERIMWN